MATGDDDDRDIAGAIHVYVEEVARQGSLFDFGIGLIEAAVRPDRADRSNKDVELVAGITVSLSAAAFASKMLWPIPGLDRDPWRAERGRALRERLKVADDSPLKSRSVRDSLEHFDERIDQFAREPYNAFGAFHWMVMSSAHGLGESNAMPILRYIDPTTLVVRLPGRTPVDVGGTSVTVDLRVVGEEFLRIRGVAGAHHR
ncbi:hypothetical protein [Rhodococcus sp. 1168]|uniref:hypothetical protein n=1 Tax=Rhodococcus sp. 1168 TaxID=2018041 RepID=UPI000A0A4990|nr:hypothetical protein [Rhodococcus sp. 1168]ORI17267.1 hypothetical protein BJI47_13560 [Rhodococcus sp. 1168]